MWCVAPLEMNEENSLEARVQSTYRLQCRKKPHTRLLTFNFKCLSREQYVGSSARVEALCSNCLLQKYLERWGVALYEAGWSALTLMKGSKIPRTELNTVHLYQHYSLFKPNKLQYFFGFFIRAISKLYICIPTNCTQLIYFINNTLKHMYCLKL